MLNIGNAVRLNSGGPTMVVESIQNTAIVKCSWHDASGNKVFADFNEAMLTVVKPTILID